MFERASILRRGRLGYRAAIVVAGRSASLPPGIEQFFEMVPGDQHQVEPETKSAGTGRRWRRDCRDQNRRPPACTGLGAK